MTEPADSTHDAQRALSLTASDGPGAQTIKVDGVERQFFDYL